MDAETFREQVLQHKDRVFSYAVWMLGNREEASDVAQEALVKLWQHREKIRPPTARGWLLKTTYRMCIDRIRRRKVRQEIGGEELYAPVPHGSPGPERLTSAGETGRAIAAALGKLQENDRAVVLLREVQGLAYDEIARTLEMPLGTVKAKLHRARDRLRRELVESGVRP
jgi:RNA polymerase sigma-70 factor (ECF subfamily)